KHSYEHSVVISAERGIGIGKLNDALLNLFEQNFVMHKVKIRHTDSKFISKIYDIAEVQNAEYDEDYVILNYRASSSNHNLIKKSYL
ncbi:MAG: GTP-binding protein HflX, GTP-binding protein HflX, partial [Candidatus Peregrinibacteria bacterium GW2011_GWE2_39_6]